MCLAVSTNISPVFLTTFGETFGGEKGLSAEQLGRIPAIIFAAMVIGIVLTGPLADLWGTKIFVLSGLGFVTAGLCILACAMEYWVVLMAAAFLGLGAAMLEVVLSPIVAAAQPHRRTSALNLLHLFYCVGAVATVLIGSVALHFHISWRIICICIMMFPILVFFGFTRIITPSAAPEPKPFSAVGALFGRPYIMAAALAIFLAGAAEVGIVQWLPAYAERGLGYSKATGGISLAVFSICMGLGRYLVSRWIHKTDILSLMIVCSIVLIFLLIAGCFSPYAGMALTACVLIGFAVACFWPSILAVAADHHPQGGASMFALLSAMGNIGCVVMPWLIGVFAEQINLKAGILSTVACPMMLILLFGWMKTVQQNGERSTK